MQTYMYDLNNTILYAYLNSTKKSMWFFIIQLVQLFLSYI